MIFRFTLSHENDSLVISEPSGWEDAVLKLERDENFHSLIEYFDGEFIFYGDNGIQNGGIDFIKNVESTSGPDADLNILIEISFDGYSYETVFTGLLDLSTIEEMTDNMLKCAIIRNDFWAKFINRQETQVNLQDNLSVDGEIVQSFDSVNLSMLPQLLIQKSDHTETSCYEIEDSVINVNEYIQIDFDTVVFDEINTKYNYPITSNPARPFEIFTPEFAGDYTFNVRVVFAARADYLGLGLNWSATTDGGGIAQNPIIEVYFQINDNAAIAFNYDSSDPDVVHPYSYNGTHALNKGDFVRIYGILSRKNTPATGSYWIIGSALPADINTGVGSSITDGQDTHLYVTANTIFPETNAEGFLLRDVAAHILDRIISRDNTLQSDFLTSPYTQSGQSESDGCGWFYILLKGLQIRQYSLLEKPFFMSFKQWWDGANPILNLGLGYENFTDSSSATEPTVNDYDDAESFGSGVAWTLAHPHSVTVVGFSPDSEYLRYSIQNGIADIDYSIGYDLDFSTGGTIQIRLWDSTFTSFVSESIVSFGGGNETGTATLTPNFIPYYLTFRGLASGGSVDYDVSEFTFDADIPVVVSDEIEVIRIEEKEHFYDPEISVYFDNVREIRRFYDTSLFFNNVETGYKKWESENSSGIDDPQTKRTYSSRFKKIGQKTSILSDFIAAGLAIETTRRKTREKSADYKFDNDTFIVSVNPVPVDISPETSPDVVDFEPEFNDNFSSITGLLNSDSRYNLRLTPARNFLRWLNYLSGCLQDYVLSVFKFSSGEGNYDMESTMNDSSPDCHDRADFEGVELGESENIPVTDDYLFYPVPLEVTIPMEWEEYKTIRENRKKAIGISQTTSNHAIFFIKNLEYEIAKGEATMVIWPKEPFELQIINDVPETTVCVTPEVLECAMIDEGGEVMITESGDTMILEEC